MSPTAYFFLGDPAKDCDQAELCGSSAVTADSGESVLQPDLQAAPIRLRASGPPRPEEDDWFGVMRFFLRQRRRARTVRRAIEALVVESAWSRPSIPLAIRTDRHELGSAARDARGGARLDRF